MTAKPDNKDRTLILGIETSCDETAAAVVDTFGNVVAERLLSQIETHREFGGVVPEIAARQHIRHLDGLIADMMAEAGLDFKDLSAIAATTGPGLVGGLMVGAMTARGLAAALGKPFIPVNHLEGHALTARLTDGLAFPYLLLLVSGGHCQLLGVFGPGDYRRIGTTIDDAVGEAFDKTAKLLGLPYPGGPAVERAAKKGDATRFKLPRPMLGKPGADFSFSGLKTAVRREAEKLVAESGALRERDVADLCAAFQAAIGDCLADRLARAVELFRAECAARGAAPTQAAIVLAGGVAANGALRTRLQSVADAANMPFHVPPPRLCTDNGVMIAWAAAEYWNASNGAPNFSEDEMRPRPRWPLDPEAIPKIGHGKKGGKA